MGTDNGNNGFLEWIAANCMTAAKMLLLSFPQNAKIMKIYICSCMRRMGRVAGLMVGCGSGRRVARRGQAWCAWRISANATTASLYGACSQFAGNLEFYSADRWMAEMQKMQEMNGERDGKFGKTRTRQHHSTFCSNIYTEIALLLTVCLLFFG